MEVEPTGYRVQFSQFVSAVAAAIGALGWEDPAWGVPNRLFLFVSGRMTNEVH
jgi:hypothetical protein